jgi:hypothetical protein
MKKISLIAILIFSTWDLRVGFSGLTIGQLSIFLYLIFSPVALANKGTLRSLIRISLLISLLILSDLAAGGGARISEAINSIMFLTVQLIAGAIFLANIRTLQKQTVVRSFLFVIAFFSCLSVVDLIARSVWEMNLVFLPGGNLADRSFFSDDANWPAILVAALSGYIVLMVGERRAVLSLMLAAIVVIYAGSRAAQFIWMLSVISFVHQKGASTRALFYLTLACSAIIITFTFSQIFALLPSEYTYDLLDFDRNPRIVDYAFIFQEMQAAGDLAFGAGFGPIDLYTSGMAWRESYPVSNQLWLQILANFGFFGLTIFILLSFSLLYFASSVPVRLAFLALIFSLQFHNFSQKPFFGILFFSGIYATQLSKKRASE